IWGVNVIAGFSFADTEATGVSFSVITTKPEAEVRHYLDALSEKAWKLRETGVVTYPSVTDVLASLGTEVKGPIILVEPSDNIGGGAGGDGTGVLRALLESRAQRAVVVINDPDSVRRAQAVPVGANVRLEVGGRSWPQDLGPVVMEAEVVSCSDGKFDLEDIHSHMAAAVGRHVDMGSCAVVRYHGVTLLLTSKKTPPFDLGQLRSQGIEPTMMTFIGVKAAVAHRRAYDPIAVKSYFVDTPGPCSSDLSLFRFVRLRRPVYPLDPIP
ncbi:MAG TPA: MlrC C-terminal domain-containing protein, partial [Opitutaceae bacterium]|nr:MlrC C-terminal domain-containing protein [Opitutaceae bacterium]